MIDYPLVKVVVFRPYLYPFSGQKRLIRIRAWHTMKYRPLRAPWCFTDSGVGHVWNTDRVILRNGSSIGLRGQRREEQCWDGSRCSFLRWPAGVPVRNNGWILPFLNSVYGLWFLFLSCSRDRGREWCQKYGCHTFLFWYYWVLFCVLKNANFSSLKSKTKANPRGKSKIRKYQ